MTDPKHAHVHAESVRVGIRLSIIAYTGHAKPPPEDVVRRILDSRPAHMILNEFPLETITNVHRERQAQRRATALRAMEVLLAKAGDSSLMSAEDLEKIATRAWRMAAYMEAQENVSATMDSLAERTEG